AGRNAIRQGSLNVATWVIVNGRLGSGFSSPALICASAVSGTSVSSKAACRSDFMYLLPSEDSEGDLALLPSPQDNAKRSDDQNLQAGRARAAGRPRATISSAPVALSRRPGPCPSRAGDFRSTTARFEIPNIRA